MKGNLIPKRTIATRKDGTTYETTVHVRIGDGGASNFRVVNGGVPTSSVSTSPSLSLQTGELLSEVKLRHGIVRTRRLFPGREPVVILTADNGDEMLLGTVMDTMNVDEDDAESKEFGFIADLTCPADEQFPRGFVKHDDRIGIASDLIPGHRTGWPMGLGEFADVARPADDGSFDWESSPESNTAFGYGEQDAKWEPARLLEEWSQTQEGRSTLLAYALPLNIEEVDNRYPVPPFLR